MASPTLDAEVAERSGDRHEPEEMQPERVGAAAPQIQHPAGGEHDQADGSRHACTRVIRGVGAEQDLREVHRGEPPDERQRRDEEREPDQSQGQ